LNYTDNELNDFTAFVREIVANPKDKDDVNRLVFADWLDDHDDPWGEFIRLQIEIDREQLLTPAWRRVRTGVQKEMTEEEKKQFALGQERLIRERQIWQERIKPTWDLHVLNDAMFFRLDQEITLPYYNSPACISYRGFPGYVECPFGFWENLSPLILSYLPIVGVSINDKRPAKSDRGSWFFQLSDDWKFSSFDSFDGMFSSNVLPNYYRRWTKNWYMSVRNELHYHSEVEATSDLLKACMLEAENRKPLGTWKQAALDYLKVLTKTEVKVFLEGAPNFLGRSDIGETETTVIGDSNG